MKKMIIAALLLTATSAFGFNTVGTGNHSIVNTAHDLGKNINTGTNPKKQICIFCHTPHNAEKAVPLWNRYDGAAVTKFYNESPSLTSTGKGASLASDSISMFCMNCHDGVTALGNIRNAADTGYTSSTVAKLAAGKLANFGTDLSRSHPIGFSYVNAQAEDAADPRLNATNDPKFTAVFPSANAPFYTSTKGTDQMECSSCHKVHDNFYPPFLRASNNRSALCLGCHNK